MKIINADVYCPDGAFVRKDVFTAGERIVDAPGFCEGESGKEEVAGEICDGNGCYCIPGLVDIHFHGALGYDVCDDTMEAFETIGRYELSRGITAMCPATLTLPVDELKNVLSLGAEFAERRTGDCADLIGFNMEGPFISHEKKGAQNGEYILPCSVGIAEEFLNASKGLVKIIGLAPEVNPGFEKYIESVKDKVKVSLAHTAADYDTSMRAFEAEIGRAHV